MTTMFTAEFFRGNRERLRKLFTGTAPIVLTAHGLQQWSTDCAYHFKQDGSFWYLTGIEHPNVVLVMDKGREYLIIPKLSASREAFDGAIDISNISALSGIEEVLYEKEGWKRLEVRLKRVNTVAVLSPAPAYVEALGMYTNPARRQLMDKIKHINKEMEFLDLRQHLQRMRMIKQPLEIDAITRAVNITTQSLKQLRARFEKGRYSNEFEAELDLSREFYKRGGSGHGFPPIIAAGAKGSILHADDNKDPILSGQQLLVDVGAEYDHYTADITRTWHAKPDKRFKAIYQSVSEVADYACSLLKPGVILREYEAQIEKFMGEKLRALGLIKVIDHDSVRQYFPSLTSHFLGIDVHDVGDYEQPLQPGAVVTVEPGIYVPAEGIGVRIEDDVLINDKGCTILSASLDKN
jgi:Xaa-Pro aminopeptidase